MNKRLLIPAFFLVCFFSLVTGIRYGFLSDHGDKTIPQSESQSTDAKDTVTQKETQKTKESKEDTAADLEVPMPDIDSQLLSINDWSRPGKKIESVDYIVIHYLGNPKTTAQENRDYFEDLKNLQTTSMSANFIVGLEGEIIQCVPEDEIAFASNDANKSSISIENCHLDKTGRFLTDTYISLVKLTGYLIDKYDLTTDDIIRHYDVTGKQCPVYYVENEDAWEIFKDDVALYCELCHSGSDALDHLESQLIGIQYTYASADEAETETETEKETEKKKETEKETERPETYEEPAHEEVHEEVPPEEEHFEEPSYEEAPVEEPYYEEEYYEEPSYDESGGDDFHDGPPRFFSEY